VEAILRTGGALKQCIIVHDDDAGAWKQTRDTALHDVLTARELTERDPHVTLQSQQVRQSIHGRRGLAVHEHNSRRAV